METNVQPEVQAQPAAAPAPAPKKKVNVFLIVAGVLLVMIASWMYAVGYFSTVTVTEEKIGPFTLVYQDMKGDYAKTGAVMDKLYASLAGDKVFPTKGFGIYYDNPKMVKKDDLRSKVGCIIEGKDVAAVKKLKKKYTTMKLDKKDAMVVRFPIKNKASFIIGIMKAYPALTAYAKDKGYGFVESMEIYDMTNKVTLYTMNIVKQKKAVQEKAAPAAKTVTASAPVKK